MIKFFRTIRQNLLSENKISKYLAYAVGEILLVVIGILIALQINNWNDLKKEQANEIKLFQNALLDLEEEAESIYKNLQWFIMYQDSYQLIYEESKGLSDVGPDDYSALVYIDIFRPVIHEKYGDNLDYLGNEKIQELFQDLIWREKLTIESIDEWNTNKMEVVRPFFREHGISNVDSIYSDTRYEFLNLKQTSLVDPDRLRSQYGTPEFDQILYDFRYKSAWVMRCLENLSTANVNLTRGLMAIIANDLETLESIESVRSTY